MPDHGGGRERRGRMDARVSAERRNEEKFPIELRTRAVCIDEFFREGRGGDRVKGGENLGREMGR